MYKQAMPVKVAYEAPFLWFLVRFCSVLAFRGRRQRSTSEPGTWQGTLSSWGWKSLVPGSAETFTDKNPVPETHSF